MKRWMVRLLLLGGSAALLAYLWSRFNQDIDEDELEDEIPIEFDVPAGDAYPAPDAFLASETAGQDTGEGPGENRAAPATDIEAPAAEVPASAEGESVEPDDLTKIRGIGPVYQKRLHEMGIMTFQQLAELNRAAFDEEGFSGVGVDLDSWIEQARGYAAQTEA